jgi:General secretion pathway protein M.
VTDSHVMRLVRRVVQEHRRAVVIIAAAFGVNVLLYLFVVRPLNQSVATVEQRTVAAEQAKAAAQAEYDRANGTLSGKARATKELDTFYSMVLAQDLSGARRLTYGRVQRLAQENRLAYQGSRYEPVEERGSTLTKLKVSVVLTGTYNNLRSFIHTIESAPQFVVIENISLAEGSNEGSLRLALDLSTYYRSASK